ncbi:MAG: hypothetical protein HQL31_13745, partial [Planctomycetes bacterium]|nr:hypothetical protein [Planctomycetota bacterium]
MAHELKNPLNSISASLYYISSHLPAAEGTVGEKIAKHTSIINQQIERSRGIIDNMRSFSGPKLLEVEEVNLNDLIRKSVPLAIPGKGVEALYELDEKLPLLRISKQQVQQVLINIMTNAVRAMDGNGTLTLRTRVEAGHVVVSLADSGSGIPPEILDRIFDPFFSTKDEVEGVGLGLSICQGIMKKH